MQVQTGNLGATTQWGVLKCPSPGGFRRGEAGDESPEKEVEKLLIPTGEWTATWSLSKSLMCCTIRSMATTKETGKLIHYRMDPHGQVVY
jgi:hypothetical protein